MLSEILVAAAFQLGPFYEQKGEDAALRPFWSREGQTTDVVWPLFTSHENWWRLALFVHHQTNDDGFQFDLLPLYWQGVDRGEAYWGLFPLYGNHPHIALIHDFSFALWPLWMQYRMPRPGEQRWLTTNAVLWPFIHWRDDGSWGFWPFYVSNHQRESFHQAALWPLVTWATYEPDRDTSGAGSSWMVWPLAGGVTREREDQWMILPPLFSLTETRSPTWCERGNSAPEIRVRCPWPFFEYEDGARRERLSVFPFYEHVELKSYSGASRDQPAAVRSSVTRFGWKLVELYDDETRVFPFWVSRKDGTYFRLWPFWESKVGDDGARRGRFLTLLPIRNVPAIDRNWAKFWTLYERAEATDGSVEHSLFWGLISWRTEPDEDLD